jgi:hypothetical protein
MKQDDPMILLSAEIPSFHANVRGTHRRRAVISVFFGQKLCVSERVGRKRSEV